MKINIVKIQTKDLRSKFLHENRQGDPYAAANLAASYALMNDFDEAEFWIGEARARGAGNRWELEARHSVASWSGDWDALFRAGQLHQAADGAEWQGYASLGQSDWEAARASFKRNLSRLEFRRGDAPHGGVLMSLVGLALAEKRLGLESWVEHAAGARAFTEDRLGVAMNFGSWPSTNGNYILARIAAIEGDVERVVIHMRTAMEQNELEIQFFANDPFFAEVRDEPRLLEMASAARARGLAEHRKLRPVGAPN
mgnify:FL=1